MPGTPLCEDGTWFSRSQRYGNRPCLCPRSIWFTNNYLWPPRPGEIGEGQNINERSVRKMEKLLFKMRWRGGEPPKLRRLTGSGGRERGGRGSTEESRIITWFWLLHGEHSDQYVRSAWSKHEQTKARLTDGFFTWVQSCLTNEIQIGGNGHFKRHESLAPLMSDTCLKRSRTRSQKGK